MLQLRWRTGCCESNLLVMSTAYLDQVATRKLQIKKLAPVLSFQLKVRFVPISEIMLIVHQRFAHNATSTKIELPIRFPSKLDMRPFVEGAGDGSLPASMFMYDLFAVVTHEGKLDNGHYWAEVLSGDEWWHCDDDKGELCSFDFKPLVPLGDVLC